MNKVLYEFLIQKTRIPDEQLLKLRNDVLAEINRRKLAQTNNLQVIGENLPAPEVKNENTQ